MPSDLTRFGRDDLLRCGDDIRRAADGAPTLEGAARALCRLLYDDLAGPHGGRACVLVRCYKTHSYGALPPELQRFAKRIYGTVAISPPEPGMRCLTLLATVGDEPDWNDRRASRGHQAIPLPARHIVERAPMIAQLIREFGLDLARAIRPSGELVRHAGGEGHGIFHVEEAAGSPYIPAQEDFVLRCGVRSVLGFGGLMESGDIVAAIIFARVPIPVEVAERFRTLALELTRLASRFDAGAAFDDSP